ncbi:MAG: DNA polymerase III subunit beta, partial [Thiohalomonadales bacterium]
QREALLKPLQAVVSVVERRQTMAILSNVLLNVKDGNIAFTATDMEIEMVAHVDVDVSETGSVTVPARKFTDICKALPDGATLEVELDNEQQRLTIRSGKSRFNLSTLPANDFPNLEDINSRQNLSVPQSALKTLIENTQFAMAQQDVRYYLNGLLLEIASNKIRTVATDGHRLAFSEQNISVEPVELLQIILPRKGVLELVKLLEFSDESANISIGSNHIRIELDRFRFTSKLIDGRYPDYQSVIPTDGDRIVAANRMLLKDALSRTAILSNEKFRGIRVKLTTGLLQSTAHNPEREEAQEEIEVEFEGPDLEAGFNVNYLLDALNIIQSEEVNLVFGGNSNSCVIKDLNANGENLFVVMPMKL